MDSLLGEESCLAGFFLFMKTEKPRMENAKMCFYSPVNIVFFKNLGKLLKRALYLSLPIRYNDIV